MYTLRLSQLITFYLPEMYSWLLMGIVPISGKADLRHNTDRRFDMPLKTDQIKFLRSEFLYLYGN